MLNFPPNPTIGLEYSSGSSATYRYDGVVWKVITPSVNTYERTSQVYNVTESSVWNINHNLQTTTPSVDIYVGDEVIIPQSITTIDENNTQIILSTASSGSAVFKK